MCCQGPRYLQLPHDAREPPHHGHACRLHAAARARRELLAELQPARGFQPQTFTYGNVGSKWNYSWQAYIEDDPVTPSQPANLYVRGGGQETYTGYNAGTQSYARHSENRALVVRVSTSPVRYERRLVDGSVEEYGQPDGALTFPRKVFLTKVTDPRATASPSPTTRACVSWRVTDAIGQVTTLSYELPADPLKLTKVTDPFGRFATLAVRRSGRLASITDVIGMMSAFQYGPSDFITVDDDALRNHDIRRLRTTDADAGWRPRTRSGGRERLEYVNIDSRGCRRSRGRKCDSVHAAGDTNSRRAILPGAAPNYNYRNTFFWSKLAMARAPGKYSAAKLVHWLHAPGLTQTSGVIENEKEPLESMRTFYKYPDRADTDHRLLRPALGSRPGRWRTAARRSPSYEYNARGRKTKEIDPLAPGDGLRLRHEQRP